MAWTRWTDRARQALRFAEEEASYWGTSAVATEHLLLGLLHDPSNISSRILARLGVDASILRSEVEGRLSARAPGAERSISISSNGKRVSDLAYEEPTRLNVTWIGTEHLLLGLLRGGGMIAKVFQLQGVSEETCRSTIKDFYRELAA